MQALRQTLAVFMLLSAPAICLAEVWRPLQMDGLADAWLLMGNQLETYQAIHIEEIGVWHLGRTDDNDSEISEALRNSTRIALTQQVQDMGFNVAATSSKDALTLRVQIIDLQYHDASAYRPALAQQYRFPIAPQHVTFVIEVVEGQSDAVVLRAAAMETLQDSTNLAQAVRQAAWTSALANTLRPEREDQSALMLAYSQP